MTWLLLGLLPMFLLPLCRCCRATAACGYCATGTMPANLQVVISGITTIDETGCLDSSLFDCEHNNSTFVLPDTFLCTWRLAHAGACCLIATAGTQEIKARLDGSSGSNILTVVTQDSDSSAAKNIWQKDFGTTAPNCLAWSGVNVPFASSGCGFCDASASTCEVTAL